MKPEGAPAVNRIAVFDVGTNTLKALAVEASGGGFRVLGEHSLGTRLGQGVSSSGVLDEAAMGRTLEALAAVRGEFEALGVGAWRAVATSAVRDAANGAEFARRFRDALGFDLRVLRGEEEADLVFRAAAGDPSIVAVGAPALVMNSGGGSAEWALGVDGNVGRRASLPLGCVRMTERFLRGDPYGVESVARLTAHYEECLAPIAREFAPPGGLLVGTGGSLCAVAAMIAGGGRFREEAIHGRCLSDDEVAGVAARLCRMTAREREAIPSLPAQRADIVAAGATLFAVAMRVLGARRVAVSTRGLRYGVLRELLGASAPTARTMRR